MNRFDRSSPTHCGQARSFSSIVQLVATNKLACSTFVEAEKQQCGRNSKALEKREQLYVSDTFQVPVPAYEVSLTSEADLRARLLLSMLQYLFCTIA